MVTLFWIFKNTLIFDCNFVKEMKCIIHGNKNSLVTEGVFDQQFRKHELENEQKIFEKSLSCNENIG